MKLKKLLGSSLLLVLLNLDVNAFDASVDRLLDGTLMCSGSESKAALAFDDNVSTYYSTSDDKMQWVGLDLGEPHVITRVGYTSSPNSSGPDRMLLSLFEGANSPDFMDAIPLYLISEAPAKNVATTADISVSRGFRYVRYVGSAGSYCNVAELKFYGHAGEGDDSQFYQITNLPTLSIHVQDNILPTIRGEDFESQSVLIYENGTRLQEYPILFRVRGNFSATHENKAFRMKYNDGKSHHVMKGGQNESPVKAKKWVLINSYRDKTLMRNPVAWAMSKRAEMKWTPWSQVVDLVVNGDYHGTYTLADHVDVHEGRIDITEMNTTDIDEETITGGYYVEVDNNASREPYWFNSSHGNPISVHDPDEDIMQYQQFQYIRNAWNNMENVVFGANYTDSEVGQRSVLDMETFLRHFLTSEFNGNTDMLCQVFLYKERGDDHFYIGPVWDADLALENDQTTYPANQRMDWTYKVRDTGNWTQFVERVLSDPSVFAQLQGIWTRLRKNGNFNPDDVASDVDSLRREIRASARLNFIRWPYLNQWLSLNPAVPGSWEAEVDRVRNYVRERVAWMDEMLYYGTVRQEGGVYQINSPLDLCSFAQIVNNGEDKANAKINADINMIGFEEDFVPIGSDKVQYAGKFNGDGHVISNLNITGKNNVGLFGMVTAGTEIQNLNLAATCSVSGDNYVGGLIGYVRTGKVTIKKCSTAATVTATGGYAAGFLGYSRMMGNIYLQDSYNLGRIQADSMAAALVAPSKGKIHVTDCYNAGKITGSAQGKEFAYTDYKNGLELQNCYDAYSNQVERVTPIDVRSGALCYLLNTGMSESLWYQNIDNGCKIDGHPVLNTSSGIVYNIINGMYSNFKEGKETAHAYRYYKWDISAIRSGTTIQFSEFDLLDMDGSDYSSLTIYNGTESTIANRNWPNVADNDVTTKYCSAFQNSAYFLFDAQEKIIPYGYRIYTARDTETYPGRNPYSWRLYGSNTYTDDPDDHCWELIDEQINNSTLQGVNFTPFDFWLPIKEDETSIKSPTPAPYRNGGEIYDLAGRKVQGARSKGQEDTMFNVQRSMFNGLKRGIYIVNGRKVFYK